jgi:uncharacterized membrane protein
MSNNLKVMTIDDVVNDEDLKRYFEYNRKTINFFAYQFAVAAASLKAMLKDHDKRAGRNRRAKVARPLALAAGIMVLVAKYLALSARRFDQEYATERQAAGRQRRAARSMRFGGS